MQMLLRDLVGQTIHEATRTHKLEVGLGAEMLCGLLELSCVLGEFAIPLLEMAHGGQHVAEVGVCSDAGLVEAFFQGGGELGPVFAGVGGEGVEVGEGVALEAVDDGGEDGLVVGFGGGVGDVEVLAAVDEELGVFGFASGEAEIVCHGVWWCKYRNQSSSC